MTAPTLPHSLHLAIFHSGRTLDVSFPPSTPLAQLLATVQSSFDVSRSTAKLLLKGKKLPLDDDARSLGDILSGLGVKLAEATEAKPLKILLVGPQTIDLQAFKDTEALREKKHAAFLHHQAHAAASRPSSSSRTGIHTLDSSSDDPDRFRFYELEPFPKSVPQWEKRRAMLERLASDKAVRDVMKRHQFAVGVLTELHPILQPTLLGLNTNSGEKISLRLLTDAMDGLRSYTEVRRVLLHELAHNKYHPHDTPFKELNSLLNRQVATFESSPTFEAWDPAASSASASTPEAHRLNEIEAERVSEQLRFGVEDEVNLKRDRVGRAAEERRRRERDGMPGRG
ncbi:hypothetical protein JCM21900_006584 [Sporobolomyces salmonicolor]